jgi:integrase
VGEYTKPRFVTRNGARVSATRTKQFKCSNVGFFKNGEIVARTSSLDILLSCDAATLKISNQKNGRMGETIHHQATGHDLCPVKALARRVHHITSNNGEEVRLLCEYCIDNEWHSIRSNDIITMVRLAAKLLNLDKQGIDPDLIGAHSLRAGGAMALKMHGFDNITIMKMGRWTSLTFTQYIHNQIAHLAKDISSKMSMPLPFLNIASIES